MSLIPNVKKIAILRSGALGDFIVILPALKAIKECYPQAEIVVLGKPWMKDFLKEKRTPVDRLIEVPLYKGIREDSGKLEDKNAINDFFKEMQYEAFDIALQFQGKGTLSNSFINRIGARLTAGMTCNEAEDLDRFVNYYYYQSEVIRYLEVAALIGAKSTTLEPEVKVLKKDLQEADTFLRSNNISSYIVLHPCAMDIRRSWPKEKFAELGNQLTERGYTIIFTGSLNDFPTIQAIIEQIKGEAINACGKLSLGGLSALLLNSSLVISSDTGPLHLARAVGAQTIGIYWAPNLINWGPVTRQNHRPVVSWKMECSICGMVPNDPFPFEPQGVTCNHNISFVQDVQVGQVMNEAEIFLNVAMESKSTPIQ